MGCFLFSDLCKFHTLSSLCSSAFSSVMSLQTLWALNITFLFDFLLHYSGVTSDSYLTCSNSVTDPQFLSVIMKPKVLSLQHMYLVAKPDLGKERPSFYSSTQSEYSHILLQKYGCVWLCNAAQSSTVMLNNILYTYHIFFSKTS